jgi:hypothetical protein
LYRAKQRIAVTNTRNDFLFIVLLLQESSWYVRPSAGRAHIRTSCSNCGRMPQHEVVSPHLHEAADYTCFGMLSSMLTTYFRRTPAGRNLEEEAGAC